jgi:hypothetical protein
MKKLIIIPFLFILLSVQGQIGRYPFYRGVTAAEEEPSSDPPSFLTTDGYTEMWYMIGDDITHTDGSVSQWDDISGNNRDMVQSIADYRPQYLNSDSVYFAADDILGFNFGENIQAQPITIYMVINQITETNGRHLLTLNGSALNIRQTGDGRLDVCNFTLSGNTMNTWKILTVVLSGENSLTYFNDNTPSTGEMATYGMNYTVLIGETAGRSANMSIKELIVRVGVADDETDRGGVVDYLNAKYSIF